MPMTERDADRIAQSLCEAARDARAIPPIRHVVDGLDVNDAYDVQRRIVGSMVAGGARRVGRKIGLTSPAVQQQLGVDQPDFGVLLEDMQVAQHGVVVVDELIQPKVEAEVAFVLAADLDLPRIDRDVVVAALSHASAALEIVDSRIENWDISIVDTIADNGSSGRFVLGDRTLALREFDPRTVQMTMTSNDHVVSRGDGSACLGDPLNAVVWLANTARDVGDPLRAGEIVLSGALGPMHTVVAGDSVRADLTGLGSVSVDFVRAAR